MNTSFYINGDEAIPAPIGVLSKLKYLVIDVDGTMTDGGIYYDENGNEYKKFCTKDAAGFFAAKKCKIKLIVLTGRKCAATTRRMKELHVDYIEQNVTNKPEYLTKFMQEHHVLKENMAYIGDDLNDYIGMKMTGYVGCPKDAVKEIQDIADYTSLYTGGTGAVRDIIMNILESRGQWEAAINSCYKLKY